jgi:predicted amidohydrolase YtcJ
MCPKALAKRAALAFLDCSIFTGKGFRKGNIVVRDGIIESVDFGDRPRLGPLGDADIHHCGGRKAMPALFDAHMHLFEWGIARLAIDLTNARSGQEIFDSLDKVYEGETENEMFSSTDLLWAVDYDDSDYGSPFRTSASELDRRYGGCPVLIKRVDGHIAYASSAFLERHEGLLERTPDGKLDDTTGLDPVHSIPIDGDVSSRAFTKAREMLWSLGVVGGVEITSMDRYPLFRDAFSEQEGGLKLSLSLVADFKGDRRDENIQRAGRFAISSKKVRADQRLPLTFLKAFADGSIGAKTASFSVPYLDGSSTGPMMSAKDVTAFASDCEQVGLMPMVHAIGDQALGSIISGMRAHGGIARVEHMEYIRPDQFGSLSRTRIISCMQPNFESRWGRKGGLYESRLGPLYTGLNRFAMVRDAGIPLCFGTDLMPPGPMGSLRGATHHPDPSACIGLPEAIRNFTSRAVHCSFIPHATGKLEPGSPADILVLDKRGDPSMLLIDGEVVHSK